MQLLERPKLLRCSGIIIGRQEGSRDVGGDRFGINRG